MRTHGGLGKVTGRVMSRVMGWTAGQAADRAPGRALGQAAGRAAMADSAPDTGKADREKDQAEACRGLLRFQAWTAAAFQASTIL